MSASAPRVIASTAVEASVPPAAGADCLSRPDIVWGGDVLLKFPFSWTGAPQKRYLQVSWASALGRANRRPAWQPLLVDVHHERARVHCCV